MKTRILGLLVLLMMPLLAAAQRKAETVNYDDYFTDQTLRVDYTFAGDQKHTMVFLDELIRTDGWHGRRHHLDELPLEGTGDIEMKDDATGKVIYRTSFSTLFQEWLSTDEAAHTAKSFENVYLLPYPKQPVSLTVSLRNMHGETITTYTHRVNPADILIRHQKPATQPRVTQLLYSGTPRDCIDVVIMSEGYTEKEEAIFLKDAYATRDALLAHEPFKSMKDRFNLIAVFTPSHDSGVSVPSRNEWCSTPFGSHFDTFYSARYLTSRQLKNIHNALLGTAYEHIIILANTTVYGGGGIYNSFTLTTAHNPDFAPVVVHEFGHSFGGLADEYFYDNDVMTDSYSHAKEPWEANVTNLVDFEGKKWSSLIPKKTPRPTPVADQKKYPVGLYEGAAYSKKGFYRASYNCRMRTNVAPEFCPACQLGLRNLIEFYTR